MNLLRIAGLFDEDHFKVVHLVSARQLNLFDCGLFAIMYLPLFFDRHYNVNANALEFIDKDEVNKLRKTL